MKVGEHYQHSVITVEPDADSNVAAGLMNKHHTGLLVVLSKGASERKPIGVLTDRDLVLKVLARQTDPKSITVAEIMTSDPMLAHLDDDLGELVQAMRFAGVRRVPVVDARGLPPGIISIDDAIEAIARFLADVSGSIQRQKQREQR